MGGKRYDLILMDIQMPRMSGLDCTKCIRQSGNDIIIFALTGYSMEDEINSFIDAGMDDCIIKPINVPELLRKIDAMKG
ncbi:MAG: response regulator [Spirochaetota bacterium]